MNTDLYITQWCIIRGNKVVTSDKMTVVKEIFVNFAAFAKSLYKEEGISYPKFYKMDNLSKLAFLAAEKIFKNSNVLELNKPEEIGIVIENSSSSLDTDIAYQRTISDKENYFPSPAVFVYTLANILIGELCIRHRIKGENAFLISEQFDAQHIERHVRGWIREGNTKAVLCGWADILDENWDTALFLIEKEKNNENAIPFTIENLSNIYYNN